MPAAFADIFVALKRVMAEHENLFAVQKDTSTEYSLVTKLPSPFPQHKRHPMWFGAVKTGKAYISFHPMPLYLCPALDREISPVLQKLIKGKTCFNFKSVPNSQLNRGSEEIDTNSGRRIG
jgi:hypothetical protein